ncbi:Atg33p NDAI_0J01900 [Naumovozyma dairenensis CBS 421]|uniref:Autophagy-related protein 33 n=1 Tax=Naumovozyma dairenensis (strain ATCC 10597 / BCRC 20456 / CBS 421 / NBRC 0211 / NRRL Y-12639) TaxID=1071378 RepID=G0WH04_NAUDC|nr:hypothetical protein NDAI_0J01900 [Naumovozyma dairenensis CBS 421]CCD27082.1 hypothetical protein NDAI_0J01900 [Naumovozyma dairenensis CBS 421]
MSVCLAVTKGIAVSSLGLYAGLLTSSTLISSTTPLITNTLPTDLLNWKPLLSKFKACATTLGSLATTFFGLSYFGSPTNLRHPYLLYSMMISPLSGIFLYLTTDFNQLSDDMIEKSPSSSSIESTTSAQEKTNLGESIVDLGKENERRGSEGKPLLEKKEHREKIVEDTNRNVILSNQTKILTKLSIATSFAIVGFVQSVVGIYGEGQFT